MVADKKRPPTIESSELSEEPNRTDVFPNMGGGISPSEAPDPDYTTYEDVQDAITAPIRLPSRESIAVHLGPLNLVDRIEEYQSDENLGHTLLGIFLGAALGMLGTWFTTPEAPISSFSIILLVIFIVIAIGVGIWLYRIKRRKRSVKDDIANFTS